MLPLCILMKGLIFFSFNQKEKTTEQVHNNIEHWSNAGQQKCICEIPIFGNAMKHLCWYSKSLTQTVS